MEEDIQMPTSGLHMHLLKLEKFRFCCNKVNTYKKVNGFLSIQSIESLLLFLC